MKRQRKGAAKVAVIPRRVYDECERMLNQRAALVNKASEKLMFARSKAFSVKSPMPDPLPPELCKRPGVNPNGIHGSGGNTDQTMNAAFAIIQAEAELCTALKWAEVFSRLDEIFQGKPEAEVADAIYTKHRQQKDVADALHYDRQSIRRLRDCYVCHCALLAAEKGLITIHEGNEDND